jgi:hypothetical protein
MEHESHAMLSHKDTHAVKHCCEHGCHVESHLVGSISTGFRLPEGVASTAHFLLQTASHPSLLYWRLFKPPRQFS